MWPLQARAEACGEVTAHGLCRDPKTVIFCHDGELETMRCPEGEFCGTDERFGGAASCIAGRLMGCGTVTEVGRCVDDTLLYCADGQLEELTCIEGSRCAQVNTDAGIAYDCVAASRPEPEPVAPGQDPEDVDEPEPIETAMDGTNASSPIPAVEQGGAGPAATYHAGGGACSGGEVGLGWLSVAFATCVLRKRR
jgi:hypothetical protein